MSRGWVGERERREEEGKEGEGGRTSTNLDISGQGEERERKKEEEEGHQGGINSFQEKAAAAFPPPPSLSLPPTSSFRYWVQSTLDTVTLKRKRKKLAMYCGKGDDVLCYILPTSLARCGATFNVW